MIDLLSWLSSDRANHYNRIWVRNLDPRFKEKLPNGLATTGGGFVKSDLGLLKNYTLFFDHVKAYREISLQTQRGKIKRYFILTERE